MSQDGRPDDQFERVDEQSDNSDEIPEFANEQNKRLNVLVKEKKKTIRKVQKEYSQDFERHKILKEHLKNVEQELLHTQSLIDAKNKETQSENHMKQVTERQTGRLQAEMKKLERQAVEFQERLNDTQVRIFRTSEKCEQLKLQLNWNQEELEQWAIAGKQKEEDNVTLQKYRKEDDAKIEDLNLQIEKLTVEVGRKQADLEKQITETQTAQIELDKTAEEFKREHDERHRLFEKWQEVTKNIARRNQDINDMGEKFAAVKIEISKNQDILAEKKTQLRAQAKLNKEEQAKNMLLVRDISDKKNENKKIEFQDINNLQAKVEILKNQLSSDATALSSKRTKLDLLAQELLAKKQRLHSEQIKYAAHQTKLRNQQKLAQKFEQAKQTAEARHRDNTRDKKKIQQQIAAHKDALVKSTQQLFRLKQAEVALYGEIQSGKAACRNLQSHINKLNQDFQRQQELLYNAEYQIQLMERKVARARGERTLEEKKDLQAEINKATATNSKIKEKHKILNEGVKKLDEDLRSVESRLAERKAVEKKYTSQIQQLTLENDMTYQDLSKICRRKEEVLVQHDIMKLEIKKIRETLTGATDNVYSLENKKNQLEMSMQEREREIQVHKDVLLAEKKAAEEERHKIAIELAERTNKVKNLKIKYEALVQKNHGTGDGNGTQEHSQAYYVIKAAQEREELQRKCDELSAKIIKSEKQLKNLQNSLLYLKNFNVVILDQYKNKGVTKTDLKARDAVKQQCDAASESFFAKRKDLQRADRQFQEDIRRYTELKNKAQTLNQRKRKLAQQMAGLAKQINEGVQKQQRAKNSLNVQQKHFQRNNINIDPHSSHLAQLEYDIEVNKNKTLLSCLVSLGEEIPEIGPLLDEALKERNVELPQRAPSEIDMMSSRGMSVRSGASGGSAISKVSRQSRQSSQRR